MKTNYKFFMMSMRLLPAKSQNITGLHLAYASEAPLRGWQENPKHCQEKADGKGAGLLFVKTPWRMRSRGGRHGAGACGVY